jgi:hypothetical protein
VPLDGTGAASTSAEPLGRPLVKSA